MKLLVVSVLPRMVTPAGCVASRPSTSTRRWPAGRLTGWPLRLVTFWLVWFTSNE